MKITHIVALIVIAVAVGIIVATAGDASEYVNFQQAGVMAADGNDEKVHVVGELKKDGGQVVGIEYNPTVNANYLAFVLVDDQKREQKVVCYNPPPAMQDFTKSEKVVVIGRMKGNEFVASEILMKCPSKYEEKELKS